MDTNWRCFKTLIAPQSRPINRYGFSQNDLKTFRV